MLTRRLICDATIRLNGFPNFHFANQFQIVIEKRILHFIAQRFFVAKIQASPRVIRGIIIGRYLELLIQTFVPDLGIPENAVARRLANYPQICIVVILRVDFDFPGFVEFCYQSIRF